MKMKIGKIIIFISLGIILSSSVSYAKLIGYQKYEAEGAGVSIDAKGLEDNTAGTIRAQIPVNGIVFKAFLYTTSVWYDDEYYGDLYEVEFEGNTIDMSLQRIDVGERDGNSAKVARTEVTDLVKSKLEQSAGEIVEFSLTELGYLDGEVLVVLYSIPGNPIYSVFIYDGECSTGGDSLTINLSTPVNKSDENFKAIMSLGISYGFQGSDQRSEVDINGNRITSSAGGQDDGFSSNGGLITAGGIGDSIDNPLDPNAAPSGDPAYRYDDELYNLAPFLNEGDEAIIIDTVNPSNDDNVFFLALTILGKATDITNPIARVKDSLNNEKNSFNIIEDIYVDGEKFLKESSVDIYVVDDKAWSGGESIGSDVGDGKETVTTDVDGNIGLTRVWAANTTPGEYDIIFDANQNGIYEYGTDAVIGAGDTGFTVLSADISVGKTVDNSSPIVRENIVFTITVTNKGPNDATGVQVKDQLPAGLTYVSDDSSGSYDAGTGIWDVGSLTNGTSATLKITAAVNQVGNITNTAARITSSPNDTNSSNDTGSATVVVPLDFDTTNSPPDAPTAINPADQTAFASGPVTLIASTFSDPEGDNHIKTHWLVRQANSVYYRSDYPASFNAINDDTTTDLTTHVISGLESGLKYVWKVGYADSGSGEISWSQEYAFMIGSPEPDSSVNIESGTGIADFKMISIVQWPEDPLAESVFGDEMMGNYDKDYKTGTYDPTISSYIEYGNGLMIEPGRAYWFLARNGLPITVDGVYVSMSHDIGVSLLYNSDTENGWNMIGCPNNANYKWDDVQVIEYDANGAIVFGPTTISALSDPNDYIDKRLWRWVNGEYASDTTVMEAYEGYWVKVKKANISLKFPAAAQTSDTNPEVQLPISSLAVSDPSDLPPRPMGDVTTGGDSSEGIGGCFIDTVFHGSANHGTMTTLIIFLVLAFICGAITSVYRRKNNQ